MYKSPFYVEPIGTRASIARLMLGTKDVLHPRLHAWLMRITASLWKEESSGISVTYGDVSIFVNLLEGAEQEIFLGRYDLGLTKFIARVCSEGDIVVDAGANVGIVSIIAANCVTRNGRVLAIEPNPLLAERLQSMKEKNDLAQVEVLSMAVGPDQGTALLHLSSSHPYSTLDQAYLPDYPVERTVEVVVETLGSLIQLHLSDARPQLVKLDLQGHENRVLLSSGELLRRVSPKYILSEFVADEWSETVHLLERCGYSLARINESGEASPCGCAGFQVGENILFYPSGENPG